MLLVQYYNFWNVFVHSCECMRANVCVRVCFACIYFFFGYILNKDLVFSYLSRFNSRDFSTTPIVLRESPEKDNGGWMRFHKAENNSRLCGIPYHRDFQLVSFSIFECRILIWLCF